MKKLTALILALALLSSIASAATVSHQHHPENVVYMGGASNTYIVASDEGYQIFAADGTNAGPVWGNMGPKQNGAYYQVLNNGGFSAVNAKGELVLADDYFAFVTAGEDWLLGIVMEETTDENADYTAKSGAKMNVLRADVAVGGQLVGSLDRSQYLTSATAGVLGDYLYILHKDGRCLFFDKNLTQTAEITLTAKPEAEYVQADGGYIHLPTQQAAFCAESTLTADQVSQKAMVIGNELIGLQGQVLAALPDSGLVNATVHGDYLQVFTIYGKGIWDLEGKEIIPCLYTDSGNVYSDDPFFASGYQAVMTLDGDLYFYDSTGEITASVANRGLNARTLHGYLQGRPILAWESAEGYTLISAKKGLLPGYYEDYDLSAATAPVIAVCKGGLWGCVDLDGNAIVPFQYQNIAISADGTLIICQSADGAWTAYQIEY